MTEIQAFLVWLVRSKGVRQSVLARRSGLTQKHVSQMLTGKAEGSLSAWQALIDASRMEEK